MFTSIQSFKESLSGDKSNAAKLRMLIDTAREMINAYNKAEEFEVLKKQGNAEIESLLDKYGRTSIIASNTLIEVVKPFTSNRLDTKEYLAFVESSVETIGADFKKVHDAVVVLATKVTGGTEYLRFNKNPKNFDTGTIIKNESLSDIWDSLRNWFIMFKQKFTRLLLGVESNLHAIAAQAQTFNTTSTNENDSYPINKYKFYYNKLLKEFVRLDREDNNDGWNYWEVKPNGIGFDYVGTTPKYSINKISNDPDWIMVDDINNITESKINETKEDPTPTDLLIILEKAKATLEHAKEQSYYEELAKMKETLVISMLKEFDAKGVAIDDKILSLIKMKATPKLDLPMYADYITNAENVKEGVAEMASNLMAIHTKVSEVSGSVRHYKDDKGLPDGTLDATFDYVNKTVVPPVDNTIAKESVGSFISNIWNSIKSFFNSFKVASKKVDLSLNQLNF